MSTISPRAANAYDVAILGTGIGGTILGAILARNGLRVLLLEQGVHPRFAIGESTIPETTFFYRVLAARYGVPEIANLATFGRLRRHVGSTHGIKRSFSFAYHRPGQAHDPKETTQYPTFAPPLGPDFHMFRQDVDAYMLAVAASYGAIVRQRTEATDIAFGSGGVTIRTKQGESFEARYVIDAGGIRSPLATLFGLREEPCPMKTRSRSLYTHMLGVRPFDACYDRPNDHGLPTPMAQATLHHLFDGGWMWVIPFDNHPASTNRLCSVGLQLEVDRFPRTGLPPGEEFQRFIQDYPIIRKQFEGAVAIREWTSSDRLQFSSTKVVGDRYCLLPHAASFVDPLFSSGLSITMATINQLAHRILRAAKNDDFSTENFRFIETWVKHNFSAYDRIVNASYQSFKDFSLWNAWMRVWMVSGFYGASGAIEILCRFLHSGDATAFDAFEEAPFRGQLGTDMPEVNDLVVRAAAETQAVRDGHKSAASGSAAIFEQVRQSGLWPAPWGGPSPELRHPGPFTLPRVMMTGLWAQRRSPKALRKHFYTVGPKDILGETARELGAELSSATSSFVGWSRAMLRPWNREWVTPDNTR